MNESLNSAALANEAVMASRNSVKIHGNLLDDKKGSWNTAVHGQTKRSVTKQPITIAQIVTIQKSRRRFGVMVRDKKIRPTV